VTQLLVDTHVLIWANAVPERLGPTARSALIDPGSELFVSAVSIAEIAIKRSIGRLTMSVAISDLLTPLDARELGLSVEHAEAVERLPLIHRDPFDRLLAAQASCDGLTLLTADTRLLAYPVATADART